jgi:hypothetical protein
MNRFISPLSINYAYCIDRAEINKFPFLHSLGRKLKFWYINTKFQFSWAGQHCQGAPIPHKISDPNLFAAFGREGAQHHRR